MDYVSAPDGPKAIGPYSHGIKANGFLFTSGMVGIDPATNDLVTESFEAQAQRTFKNLAAVLRAAGTDFSRVVKATVYLTDLGNFQTMNAIYAEYFGDHKPARTTVEVSKLPKDAGLEIDLVAFV
ncbi:MAG TPA: RidA family protein [Thermoanaerobaculia bacterium]|nr:RidA family protein [Thermoanaerobaculia bacterium]